MHRQMLARYEWLLYSASELHATFLAAEEHSLDWSVLQQTLGISKTQTNYMLNDKADTAGNYTRNHTKSQALKELFFIINHITILVIPL